MADQSRVARDDDMPPPKRRKTAIACEECRDRKRKCDGVRPVCGACARRRPPSVCEWVEERTKNGWSTRYVESLHQRIRSLEEGQLSAYLAPPNAEDAEDFQQEPVEETSITIDTSSGQPLVPHQTIPGMIQNFSPQSRPDLIPSTLGFSPVGPQGENDVDSPQPANNNSQYNGPTSEASETGAPSMTFSTTVDDGCTTGPMSNDDDPDDSGIDAMGTVAGVSRGKGSDYFGPSSTISFLSQVRDVIHKSGNTLGQSDLPDSHDWGRDPGGTQICRNQHPAKTAQSEFVMNDGTLFDVPPRREADILLSSYWTWVHTLYPFLHQKTFLQKYRQIWEAAPTSDFASPPENFDHNQSHDRLFHCTMNAVFALGCHFHPGMSASDRVTKSRNFFARAQRLLSFDLFELGTIQLVQALLLMGQYLQSTDMTSSCWNMIGLAIRTAQGMGLHIETDSIEIDQVQIELKRRVWGGCVLFDRILSMTYGRPPMIDHLDAQNLVLPSNIDDCLLTTFPDKPATQPDNRPSSIACYVQALKLQEIMGKLLATLYNKNASKDKTNAVNGTSTALTMEYEMQSLLDKLRLGDYRDLFALDNALMEWHANLPYHLKISGDHSGTTTSSENHTTHSLPTAIEGQSLSVEAVSRRQANCLESRYLFIRFILFRPVLLVVFENSQSSTLKSGRDNGMDSMLHSGILDQIAIQCLSSAEKLVDLMGQNLESENSLLPAWWYNILYLHNCAIAFLVGRLCPSLHVKVNRAEMVTNWQNCLDCIRKYQHCGIIARRCYRVLNMVDQQIFGKQYDHVDPIPGIIRSLAASPSGNQVMDRTSTFSNAKGIAPFNDQWQPITGQGSLDLSTPIEDIVIDDVGSYWMGDVEDMSWLSLMPFTSELDHRRTN